ncbi:hypothetical protein O0L34_g12397 [Tuta absoluta]|nr:hypothetical protein O0L34_g12397 [Tuta absoluta]
MASSREGRLRSIAWDHFEIKDKEKGVATCNICHEAFSYRTSVSNLMKHLRNKHTYVVIKGDNDDENEGGKDADNENSSDKSVPNGKPVKSELWEYYQVKDEANKLATCTICLDQFSYQHTMAVLTKHLNLKHSIDFGEGDEEEHETDNDDEDVDVGKFDVGVRGRRMSSVAWEYFEIKDDASKVASCNLCGALCSFKTSVSNLMKHARRKHGVAGGPEDFDDEQEDSIESLQDDGILKENKLPGKSSTGRSQRSIVWLYFKPVDDESKLSQCLICKKTLSHSSTLTNLKKHLARKHPNVKIPQKEDGRKRILLSSGGELYEVETETYDEDNDNDEDTNATNDLMETVYLEDFDLADDEPLKKPGSVSAPTAKKRKYSTSSEEEITFINRYAKKQSDSFDHFGKYLASLLRNLPKETSSRLQADFIKQIMCAEIDKEQSNSNMNNVPVTNTSHENV